MKGELQTVGSCLYRNLGLCFKVETPLRWDGKVVVALYAANMFDPWWIVFSDVAHVQNMGVFSGGRRHYGGELES